MSIQPIDATRLLDALPHAHPFRFVDEVELVSVDSARGSWSVRGNEAFFSGHFPGFPIVPGVLLAEALAQLSGLVIARRRLESGESAPSGGTLAMVDVRFVESAVPPARIDLTSDLDGDQDPLFLFSVVASTNGRCVARGRLAIRAEPSLENRSCAAS